MNKPIFYTTKEEQETHILATKIRLCGSGSPQYEPTIKSERTL